MDGYAARVAARKSGDERVQSLYMRNRHVSRLRDKATARQATPLDMTEPLLLGAHMSIGGGLHTAIERGCSINCTALQMFVKNNMQWFARPLWLEEIRQLIEHKQRGQFVSIF